MRRKVAVIGGGIAGLAAAWELAGHEADVSVTVYEGSDRVGGKLRLEQVGGALVDVGAESVLARRPEALTLFEEIGVDGRTTYPAAVGATIVAGGRRWPMPSGTVMGVPSDPESVRGLLTDAEVHRLRDEPLAPLVTDDVSVGDFVDARLGPAVTDKLVEPLLAGVYAGHARRISLDMAVPALRRAAHDGRSLLEVAREAQLAARSAPTAVLPVFATLVGGLGTLPPALEAALVDAGVEVRTRAVVRELRPDGDGWVVATGPTTDVVHERHDAVVVAVPAHPTARLLTDVAPTAAARLAAVDYASMAIITLAVDGRPEALTGTSGFLVPPVEGLTIKAATFSTSKWPWLADAHPDRTWLRASIGRHGEEASLQHDDAALVETALTDLRAVLGELPDPIDAHVQRWGGGLPQYAVGHRRVVEVARRDLPPTITLAGAAYDGVGIPACIASGRAAARALLTP
ncbi:protoporphyrinogen oxidase [Humibacillus xanthopallidus]|uniref:Coproporphyrinogen III oxidase n=1 Tax=Humibacillus xanthopallidus TaxID=412689 RepID=A0A543HHK2_9MICO|nr:protoporphyrinogen oxidase [Humibacillus xanthopallidus]TQM57799.1 oxygen-dependent protoporphyrinogen oxidase [Humibacillus xanthopallidus]